MQKFIYKSYKTDFQSIHEVANHMQQLSIELENTDLENLIYFNTTYLIITQKVIEKFNTGYFDEDQTMSDFDICFAKYYFDALYQYVSVQKSDPSWQLLFNLCQRGKLLKTQYLALGVNAHVNNDLAFALQDVFKNRKEYSDYNKINMIISQSILEVFTNYKEVSILEFFKNPLVPILKPVLNIIIQKWRKEAWKNYLALANNTKSRDHIQKGALKNAKRILLYG